MLQARDIMTTEVITVSPETLVSELTKIIAGKNIGGVPVVDAGGLLVGIVTQSDLVERTKDLELGPVINILDFHLYFDLPSHMFKQVQKMLGATVADVMSPKPLTVSPETPIRQIASLMDRQKIHTLPVMAGGKLVGIVGKMDLVRALAREEAGETA
ncbi:MAG: CBS domain-containing protein [Deltaproteobacteria bacterium]|nr:CBS domain-containing protein [Deltaproteobacteria bacterium]